jgi:hypothetical protein
MKRIQIVARIPADLRKAVGAYARRNRTTLNNTIEEALRRYVATPQPRRAPERAVTGPTEVK